MASDTKYVKAKIFKDKNDFAYPENDMNNYSDEDKSKIETKMNWGLAFSGGGTRSASLSLGQLRALKHLKILEKFKYCSTVSGGTWGVAPFIFLDKTIEDDEFLGTYKSPKDIVKGDLSFDNKKSMASAISRSKIIKDLYKHLLEGDEIYSHIIGDIFLKPFLINEKKFFTLNNYTVTKILDENDNLSKNDFYQVCDRCRPFLIVNATVLRSVDMRIPFEMTPLYCGIKKLYKNAGADQKFDIGGGYVEPHGFDSDAPDDISNDLFRVRLNRRRFTISDMLGSSGAAPEDIFRRFLPFARIFPNFKYWSPIAPVNKMIAKGYDVGDGGLLENLGIMPLLRRKVEKIVVFVNGKTPLKRQDNGEFTISDSIPALFMEIPNQNGAKKFKLNIVFDNSTKKYEKLTNALFKQQKEGLPTVFFDNYTVIENKHHNIDGGWDVDVCWVYNSLATNWVNDLNYDIKNSLVNHEYGNDFPYFNTFMENFPHIIDLNLEQTQLASQLASWMVIESKILEFLE